MKPFQVLAVAALIASASAQPRAMPGIGGIGGTPRAGAWFGGAPQPSVNTFTPQGGFSFAGNSARPQPAGGPFGAAQGIAGVANAISNIAKPMTFGGGIQTSIGIGRPQGPPVSNNAGFSFSGSTQGASSVSQGFPGFVGGSPPTMSIPEGPYGPFKGPDGPFGGGPFGGPPRGGVTQWFGPQPSPFTNTCPTTNRVIIVTDNFPDSSPTCMGTCNFQSNAALSSVSSQSYTTSDSVVLAVGPTSSPNNASMVYSSAVLASLTAKTSVYGMTIPLDPAVTDQAFLDSVSAANVLVQGSTSTPGVHVLDFASFYNSKLKYVEENWDPMEMCAWVREQLVAAGVTFPPLPAAPAQPVFNIMQSFGSVQPVGSVSIMG